MSEPKVFIVVRGLPGSGKSEFAELMLEHWRMAGSVYTTDDFWNGGKTFSRDLLKEAHEWNRLRTFSALEHSVPLVVLANTSTQEWEFKQYTDKAKKCGYRVYSIVVENRHDGINSHNVPEASVLGYENRFELQLYKENKILRPPTLTYWGKIKAWLRK